jgi:hypothetical protein
MLEDLRCGEVKNDKFGQRKYFVIWRNRSEANKGTSREAEYFFAHRVCHFYYQAQWSIIKDERLLRLF